MKNNKWITTIMEVKIEIKAGRGRSRIQFMKKIIEDIGKTSYKELNVAVADKEEWKSISHLTSSTNLKITIQKKTIQDFGIFCFMVKYFHSMSVYIKKLMSPFPGPATAHRDRKSMI